MTGTSNDLDLGGHASSSATTLAILTLDKPASPVLPRRYDILSQPHERYTLILFFMGISLLEDLIIYNLMEEETTIFKNIVFVQKMI